MLLPFWRVDILSIGVYLRFQKQHKRLNDAVDVKRLNSVVTTHESSHICTGKQICTCGFHYNDIQEHHKTIFDVKYVIILTV